MIKISVLGPGALGGTFAAWLAQVPAHDVTVCVRTPFERLQVDTPHGPLSAQPRVLADPAQASVADWLMIAVKAYDAPACVPWLRAVVDRGTSVAILQNGVEHVERFAPWLDRTKLLPVVVNCSAERSGPGVIRQRSEASCIVPATERGHAFQALFAETKIRVELTEDILTALWRKLCVNCVGAVSALVLEPARVARHDDVADLMRGLIRECIAVGRAEGAHLEDDLADSIVDGYRRSPSDSINSMYADRLASRPMEIDARNGAIVRKGAQHRIPTPLNHALVALLNVVDGRPINPS